MRGGLPPGCSNNVIARWHLGQIGRFFGSGIAPLPILGGSATELSVTDNCRRMGDDNSPCASNSGLASQFHGFVHFRRRPAKARVPAAFLGSHGGASVPRPCCDLAAMMRRSALPKASADTSRSMGRLSFLTVRVVQGRKSWEMEMPLAMEINMVSLLMISCATVETVQLVEYLY